jgi:hypothetical protein
MSEVASAVFKFYFSQSQVTCRAHIDFAEFQVWLLHAFA